MTIPDHELPGWLVAIIIGLVILCLLLALAFLGYLPSPLAAKLNAHDFKSDKATRATLISCGVAMELAQRNPIRCFDDDDPRNVFVGTR